MNELKPWLDKWQLICKLEPNGDFGGGDSHADEYSVAYIEPSYMTVDKALSLLTGPDHVPRRHPNTYYWYGRPNRCSRDQLIPRLCYAVEHNRGEFKRMNHLLARHYYLFAFNSIRNFVYDSPAEHTKRSTPDVPYNPAWKPPDIMGPTVWACLLRGVLNYRTYYSATSFLVAPIWLILCLLDVQVLVGSFAMWVGLDKDNDIRNHALPCHLSWSLYPTPTSALAWYLFIRSKPQAKFDAHWGQPGQPPLHKILAKLLT